MALIKKSQIPDIKELFNADGTLNTQSVVTAGLHAFGQHAAGHVQISNGKASQTDLGGNKKHISIEFDRQD